MATSLDACLKDRDWATGDVAAHEQHTAILHMYACIVHQAGSLALGRSQRTLCTVGQPEGPSVLLSRSPLDTQRHLFLRWPHRLLCYQSRMGKLLWLKIVMHLPQSL